MVAFSVKVSQTVEIPDDQIRGLMERANERFDKPLDSDVYPEDILRQAVIEGVIEEPGEDWQSDESIPWTFKDVDDLEQPCLEEESV